MNSANSDQLDPTDARRYKALLFDVDGTLYHQRPLRRAMMLRLARAYALRPLAGRQTLRALSAYRKAQESLREAADAHLSLAQAQVQMAADRTGHSPAFVEQCVENWMEQAPLPLLARFLHSSLVELLETARKNSLRLAVCSDYPAAAKLKALGIADYFEIVVAAQEPEVGRFKPHPLGLEVALQRLGLSAEQALYIGDRPEVDALAAARAGMDCIIVSSTARPSNADWQQVQNYQELALRLFPPDRT